VIEQTVPTIRVAGVLDTTGCTVYPALPLSFRSTTVTAAAGFTVPEPSSGNSSFRWSAVSYRR